MKKIVSLFVVVLAVFVFMPLKQVSAEEKAAVSKIPHGPAINEKMQIPSAEALGKGIFRLGDITVNTVTHEISVPGTMNMQEGVIEFIASIKGGFKLYESVLELDANAYEFNLGLILIGLDKKRGEASKFHFDPEPPKGDPVEIWVEWKDSGNQIKKHRVEDLVFNKDQKKTMPHGPWVYTGSTILEDGTYMAQRDGVLIGFVHEPAAIIDNPSDFGLGGYGAIVVNKKIAPAKGTKIRLIVRSLKKQ
jgi:hypothetical protein